MLSLLRSFAKNTQPEPNSGCLLWLARVDRDGYGEVKVPADPTMPPRWPRHKTRAHRVAFYLRHGRWPALHVLHKCDTRSCVNADHLWEGTNLDNVRDKMAKGRHRKGSR